MEEERIRAHDAAAEQRKAQGTAFNAARHFGQTQTGQRLLFATPQAAHPPVIRRPDAVTFLAHAGIPLFEGRELIAADQQLVNGHELRRARFTSSHASRSIDFGHAVPSSGSWEAKELKV